MGGIYYTTLVDVLMDAGVICRVASVNQGWEYRARSSGGFDSPPLGVCWHHTASQTSPENDLSYMINGSPDRPVGNLLLDRDGVVWPIAGGAANTQGKGGPVTLSRGTVPVDQGNTRLFAIEAANNGVGETWPQAQIDSYFKINNALAPLFGNQPHDLVTHQFYAPSRKIDPATAAAVRGPWRPNAVSSSGTWSVYDIREEAARRSSPPIPQPIPDEEDEYDVAFIIINEDTGQPALVYGEGKVTGIDGGSFQAFVNKFGEPITVEAATFDDFRKKSSGA